MAIAMDIEYLGLAIPKAYHKINQVNVCIANVCGTVTVDVYASEEQAKLGLQQRIAALSFDLTTAEVYALAGKRLPEGVKIPEIVASSPMEWCYKWLMLKPEFEKGEMV